MGRVAFCFAGLGFVGLCVLLLRILLLGWTLQADDGLVWAHILGEPKQSEWLHFLLPQTFDGGSQADFMAAVINASNLAISANLTLAVVWVGAVLISLRACIDWRNLKRLRAVWWTLLLLSLLAPSIAALWLFELHQSAALTVILSMVSTILVFWLGTVLFSPVGVKYVPAGARRLRRFW